MAPQHGRYVPGAPSEFPVWNSLSPWRLNVSVPQRTESTEDSARVIVTPCALCGRDVPHDRFDLVYISGRNRVVCKGEC